MRPIDIVVVSFLEKIAEEKKEEQKESPAQRRIAAIRQILARHYNLKEALDPKKLTDDEVAQLYQIALQHGYIPWTALPGPIKLKRGLSYALQTGIGSGLGLTAGMLTGKLLSRYISPQSYPIVRSALATAGTLAGMLGGLYASTQMGIPNVKTVGPRIDMMI